MRAPVGGTPFGRALRNSGWLLSGKGVGAALSLIYLALAARALPVAEFGRFMLTLSIAQAVAALVAFQTWQIVIRFGVAHHERGDAPALGRLVRYSAALDLGAGAVGCVIVAGAVAVIRARLGWSAEVAREALLFSFVLLLSVRSTAIGMLRLHDRYALGAAADAVTPVIRFLGAIAAVAAGASVIGFLIAWAAAEVLTAIVYWVSAHRVAPGLLGRWNRAGAARVENLGFWRFAFVTNVNSTLNAASKQFVVVLVGFVAGAVAAGGYRLAFQLSQALVRLSELFARAVFPELTRADAAETRDPLRRLFRQSTRLALGAGVTICVLAPIVGGPVLQMVGGDRYADVYPILVLLSLAAGLEVMAAGFEPLLLSTGVAGAVLRTRLIGVAVLFASVALLMPLYGLFGAAVATVVAAAVSLALFARAAYRVVR